MTLIKLKREIASSLKGGGVERGETKCHIFGQVGLSGVRVRPDHIHLREEIDRFACGEERRQARGFIDP